jgi:hypothetical protein
LVKIYAIYGKLLLKIHNNPQKIKKFIEIKRKPPKIFSIPSVFLGRGEKKSCFYRFLGISDIFSAKQAP